MGAKSPSTHSWFVRSQALIATIAVTFFFIFGAAFVVGYSHYKRLIKNTVQENRSTVNLLATIVVEHVKAISGVLQAYGSRPLLIDAAKKKDFREGIKHLVNLKENNPEIDSLFFADPDGILWGDFPVHKESYGQNFSYRDWYKGVSKEWKPYVSSVYKRVVGEKELAIVVAVPISDEKGKVIGILGAIQRVPVIGQIVKQVVLNRDMEITLLDQMGQVIFSDQFPYKGEIITCPHLPLLQKAMREGKSEIEIRGLSEGEGIEYLAFTTIKGSGWSVIVAQEKKKVFKAESGYFIQLAVISLLLFLLVAVSMIYFRKNFIYQHAMELLRSEKELMERERRYSSLLENINLIAVGLDTNGNITFANPFLLKLTVYDLEEIIGKNWFDTFLPGKDTEVVKGAFQEILLKEFHPHYENPILTKSGDERLIAWNNTILKDIHGQLLGTMSIGEDITERKQAEEELIEKEMFNFALFEYNPIQTFVVDPEGKVTQFNLAKKKSGDRLPNIGDVMYRDYAGKYETDMNAELMKCIRSGEEKEFPEQKYGNKVLSITISPFHKGAAITSQDITERKRAEAERERLLADLEAKNKELESFVYTVSHDLKAPLVSLNGFSSVLQKDYESQLGEEGKHYLERIQANVAHMEVLITSLLELSRIGQVVGSIEEIDVAALLREIRDALAVRLKEAGAEFVVQEPLPTVRADRGRIHQVFVNLIDNAVKFRSAERALRIEVGCRQESGFYRFHVADNGIGIAPQYHEQIFTPFRKLHPEIEGVGIGLALVKKIVEHHGGRVWVESEAGKGSTFYFTIPRG